MATFYNQATLSYNGTTTTSNITTGELVEVLSANKTAVPKTYGNNDRVTYVVNLVNTGNVPYTDLTVTDNLGAYAFGTGQVIPLLYTEDSARLFQNGVPTADPTATVGTALSLSGITVPARGTATIVYEARVNGFAPLTAGSTITNTVTISGGNLSTPITATETITVEAAPELTIIKSLTPLTVSENSEITYTLMIQNTGNTAATAADTLRITDTFQPILKDITVTYGGTAWEEGTNYTYDETTGLFTTVPGQITVPAATFTQDSDTGLFTTVPGTATITVTGTI